MWEWLKTGPLADVSSDTKSLSQNSASASASMSASVPASSLRNMSSIKPSAILIDKTAASPSIGPSHSSGAVDLLAGLRLACDALRPQVLFVFERLFSV